uniref:Uncharacterized protein n=1 Tax=Steinernema glaseri TaxID=37863 RepID=A0A1I7ZAV1_9BILA
MQHLRLTIYDIGLYGIGILAFSLLLLLLYLTCKYMDRTVEGYSQAPSRVGSSRELVGTSDIGAIELDDVEKEKWPYHLNYEKQLFTNEEDGVQDNISQV